MAEPISIKFHVDNTAAKKSIEEVTQALDGVARASAFGESGSTAHAINLKTNAPEVTEQTQTLATTLHDFTSTAKQAQEAAVINFQMGSAEADLKTITQALKDTSEESKKASSEASTALQATEELLQKQAEAEKKASLETQIAADDFAHSQLLKTGSLEDLNKALAEYREALSRTNKQEDAAGNLFLEKRIAQTEQAIDRQTKAIDRQTKSTERARIAEQRRNAEIIRSGSILHRITSEIAAATIDAGTAQQAAGVKAGFFSRAMTGTAAAVRGLGVAIKASLGPVGIILLVIEGATYLLSKAWEKLTSLFTAGSKASREQSKELSEQSKELGQLADEAKRAADEIERTQAREAEERQFLSVIEQVTAEYKEQTSEIEKQLRLKKYGLEDEAREIEFKHDLRKEELELQAIREDWSDRQLEVALRNNEIERMRELESISLRVSDAELKAADARVKSAQENARATAEASGGSPLVGSQEDLDIIAQDAIEAAQRVNQAIAEQKKARTDSETASRLLEQSKDWLDDSGDELEGDALQETIDILKALDYDKNKILGLDDDELKEAYRAAIKYYNDLAKNTTPDDATASAALSRTGLSLSQYIKDDGTIDIDTASKDIASRVKTGVEAFEAQTKAQEELDEAKAQKAEAERKKILEETRVERSRELNAKRVQVQDEKYQQEQAKAAKEKADAAELERRKAIYSGYNSEKLAQRVAKTEGQSGSFAQSDNAAARAALEDKLGQDIDKITEDGRISKQELSQLNNLLPLMEQAGLSAEVLAMLRQLRAIAEEQARTSNSQRAELRILKQQLAQTERAVKQQATGR